MEIKDKKGRLFSERDFEGPCFDLDKMEVLMKEIGNRVRTERCNQNLSVGDMAKLTGLAITHLYRIENGEANIGLQALIKVSYALDKPIEDFIPFEKPLGSYNQSERFKALTSGLSAEQIDFIFQFVENFINYSHK